MSASSIASVAQIAVILAVISIVLAALPASPFQAYIGALSDTTWLKYFNWFFPVSECIATLQAWLAAITAFYLVSALARMGNMID